MGKFKLADAGVAVYLLIAFVMLIVPMSEGLLDIFLTVDMGISFTILFTSMFAEEVLGMSFYPTMLLFSTIFRIALNVSSTRLILRRAVRVTSSEYSASSLAVTTWLSVSSYI